MHTFHLFSCNTDCYKQSFHFVRNIVLRLMRGTRRSKHSMISEKNWPRKNIMQDPRLKRNLKLLRMREKIWKSKNVLIVRVFIVKELMQALLIQDNCNTSRLIFLVAQ